MGATTTGATTGYVHFLNLEYFFRLLYDAVFHGQFAPNGLLAYLANIWGFITAAGLIFSVIALIMLVYALIRLKQLEDIEAPLYETLDVAHAVSATEHSRWEHIMTLVESAHENDWRQAIIEADIMLDEELTHHGYSGATVGDKLKSAQFASLDDAWEAHKVRNDIAHQGSAFPLDGRLAFRTIQKYQRVFEEFKAI